MTTPWGTDDHGPGGDPSRLGGEDRGDSSDDGGGWSSDFDVDPGVDSGVGSDGQAAHTGPVFGARAEQRLSPTRGQKGSGWRATIDRDAPEEEKSTWRDWPHARIIVYSVIFLSVAGSLLTGRDAEFNQYKMFALLMIVIPLTEYLIMRFRRRR